MVDFAKLTRERRRRRDNNEDNENSPIGIPGKQFTTQVSISIAGPDYAIKFGWDERLKNALKKMIPQSEITWHKDRKVWLVHPDEIDVAIDVIASHTGQVITLPEAKPLTPEVIEKTFLLEYLGATKDRGKKTSAYGFVNDAWSVEITEEVLRGFFEGREVASKPDGVQTFYQTLCVFEKATSEEIKKAYKRLALQWHPDVSKEEGTHEMFIKINDAYKVLIDPEKKGRYDAGLHFERQGQDQDLQTILDRHSKYGYRSPLRCGQITARGSVRLMRFTVSEILKWDDVIKNGKVMSSMWPKGADTFQILWV